MWLSYLFWLYLFSFIPITIKDECAEDQVPPTIALRNDIPILGFKSKEESDKWFQYNVEASDDCVNSLTVEIGEATSVGAADIRLFEREVTV